MRVIRPNLLNIERVTALIPRVPYVSPYTFKQKVKMATWWFVEAIFFRNTTHHMNKLRCCILRLFGAKVGSNTFISSKAKIWFPWNLEIGDNAGIGFEAIIYNLDKIIIEDYATVTQKCHLVTGSHDFRVPDFPLVTKPIYIKAGAFLGTETYVGPGVIIEEMAVIAARSVVIKNIPSYTVAGGHPCVPIKKYEVKQ